MANFPWRTHLSWLILILGGLWGISMARAEGSPGSALQGALITGYASWSLYRGLPPVWRWWKAHGLRLGGLAGCIPGGALIQAIVAFSILAAGGYFYSVFGGGLYHFTQHLRTSRRHI